MKKRANAWPWLAGLFFVSGLAGLGCQVAWAKAFAAGIGHEWPSVLAVVTALFAGMALGAFLFARLPPSWRRNPSGYGWLELACGAWILLSPLLIRQVNRLVVFLLPADTSAAGQAALAFLAVTATLLPATAAMGATLPALEQWLARLSFPGRTPLLYAANTGGAMLGALLSAFWLMPAWGMPGTLRFLGLLNLACGVAALWLLRQFPVVPPATPLPATPLGRPPLELPETSKPLEPLDKALAGRLVASGALALGFETVILRGLAQFLENTVYTFAVVLAVYLLATAAGAALFQRWQGWPRRPGAPRRPIEPALFLGLSGAVLAAGIALRWMPALYEKLRHHLGDALPAVALAEALVAAVLLLIPCLLMGAAFSALAEAWRRTRPDLGGAAGLNALGAAVAPGLTGAALIPWIGLGSTIGVAAAGYAALAGKTGRIAALPVLGLGIALATQPVELLERNGQKIVWFREGPSATVAVLEDAAGDRVLKVNNRFQMGGTAARIAEQRQAGIPLLLHAHPQSALFIGLGTGLTFATAAAHPDLQAEGVELLPEVAEAATYFLDGQTDQARKLRVLIADGRRHLRTTKQRYDVIVSDLFHPGLDGAGFLYTLESFAAARARLAPGGVFCQWLPLYQMDLATIRSITRTFLAVFPGAEAWMLRPNLDTPVIGLIARPRDAVWDGEWIRRRGLTPEFERHLKEIGLHEPIRLWGCFLADAGELAAFAASAELNRDENPVVLFQAPRVTFRRDDQPAGRMLELIRQFRSDPVSLGLASDILVERTRAGLQARNSYLTGLALENDGKPDEALAHYIESARISADFTAGYAQALRLGTKRAMQNRAAAREIFSALAAARPEVPVAREFLERLGQDPP